MALESLKCPECGGSVVLDNGQEYGFCKYCGTKVQNTNFAKIKISGEIKFDYSEELINLYSLARRAKYNNNVTQAIRYYDQILVKDPNNWEPNFYIAYFNVYNSSFNNIDSCAMSLANNINSIIFMVKENEIKAQEKTRIMNEINSRINSLGTKYYNIANSYYNSLPPQSKPYYLQQLLNDCSGIAQLFYAFGDAVYQHFQNIYGASIAAPSWASGINYQKLTISYKKNKYQDEQKMAFYANKVRMFNPYYALPATKKGCYVATSIYGSYDCNEVWVLRRYRDYHLDTNYFGKLFIKVYYKISPTIVKYFGDYKLFKKIGRKYLDKFVIKLKEKGYSDKPYNDNY